MGNLDRIDDTKQKSAPPFRPLICWAYLCARRGCERPHVVQERRVRGQHAVRLGYKVFIRSFFTDAKDIPQLLDLSPLAAGEMAIQEWQARSSVCELDLCEPLHVYDFRRRNGRRGRYPQQYRPRQVGAGAAAETLRHNQSHAGVGAKMATLFSYIA